MPRPRLTVNCVADNYVDKTRERIAEFSFPDTDGPAGGLIAFRSREGKPPLVQVYRAEGCTVTTDDTAELMQAVEYLFPRVHRHLATSDELERISALMRRLQA